HVSNVSPVVNRHGLSVHLGIGQAKQTLLLSAPILWPHAQKSVPKANRPQDGRVIASRVIVDQSSTPIEYPRLPVAMRQEHCYVVECLVSLPLAKIELQPTTSGCERNSGLVRCPDDVIEV